MDEDGFMFVVLELPVIWAVVTSLGMSSRDAERKIESDAPFYLFAAAMVLCVFGILFGTGTLRIRMIAYAAVGGTLWFRS